ncbi:Phosphoribosylformylglycinamidine cyclo-ligase [Myxozyma melibiosi]|uniref:Phosphoribosylformylglycinamidine cyclo-ligase n=1 Tax=Myxozyma melibiosi TaxID=54550 RepID=A0ABR1F778_9ASCO
MSLRILLVGNGGREHALAWKLAQSPLVEKIWVAPGNGGTAKGLKNVENVAIDSADFAGLVKFAGERDVNLVVPGPEQPLVDGIESVFRKVGIKVFGPSEAAARMEGSKTFSKDFMAKHNIPTAAYKNFTDFAEAKAYVASVDHNVVIKASGLAAGKGVLIPTTKQEAYDALKEIMEDRAFGAAGDEVVIEECLVGDELSILAFSDGYTVVDLPPAQDHKRIFDGDNGPNTGGMGTYAPAPVASSSLIEEIRTTIIKPTIDGMRKDGFPFVGMLFTGVMLTASGPKVLEYNVRFGDPETQSILPLLSKETDLAEIFLACCEHRLDAITIETTGQFGVTVVVAAGGYPGKYEKKSPITLDALDDDETFIFHAGTTITADGVLVSDGGRVIAASAVAPSLEEAVKKAYLGVDKIHMKDMQFRKDIAYRAFREKKQGEVFTYAKAGVSVDDGAELVERIKAKVKSTARSGADAELGGFGGVFDLKAAGFKDPLIVAATDGVGTKVKIAQLSGINNTVGIDLVAMNVNDLVVQGAEPLMFLDYFACSQLDLDVSAAFVGGVADGCILAGCALVGGETAEMPGIYHGDDYDAGGTAIGAVERGQTLPRTDEMAAGDVLLGLGSAGVHSNGFSLVRKIVEYAGLGYDQPAPWDTSKSTQESLLTPTRIYVKSLLPPIKKGLILGMAHITGGGLVENVPRMLPLHLSAKIDGSTWPVLPVFKWVGRTGSVPVEDINKTLNMGIGMVIAAKKESVDELVALLKENGEKVYTIGELAETVEGVERCVVSNTEDWY